MRQHALLAPSTKTSIYINLIPSDELFKHNHVVFDAVSRRAYELFECRGRVSGGDVNDWLQAESELLHSCSHEMKESAEAIIVHTEVPSFFAAEQLKIAIEPRRLIFSGEGDIGHTLEKSRAKPGELQRKWIFRIHELFVDVDPAKSTATLRARTLEIVMPKVARSDQPLDKAQVASSSR